MQSLLIFLSYIATFFAVRGTHFVDATSIRPAYDNKHVFKSRNLGSDTALRFVKDSGVCETTPGVGQISGYIDVGTNMSMVSLYLLVFNCIDVIDTAGNSGSGSSRLETTRRLRPSHSG